MVFPGGSIGKVLRRRRESIVLGLLLLVALALRVYQYDWDQGHLYHPDERFILTSTASISLAWPPNLDQLLTPKGSLIPPDFSYSYGTFSFYLLRLAAAILAGIDHALPFLHFLDATTDLGNLRLVGRPISALFDTGSVLFIYLIGRQLYGRRVGFLAATFVTFSVIDIQLSHFYATDTILTCLVLGALATSLSFLQTGRTRDAVLAGLFVGFALSTKASAVPILVPVFGAQLLRLFVEDGVPGLRPRNPAPEAFSRAVGSATVTAITAALAFLVTEPYAVIDFNHFFAGITEQGSMVRGIADLPYTRQYFGRPAYLYFIQNLVLFGVGIPLGIAMVAGSIYVVARNVRRPVAGEIVLLAYVLPYFALTGDFWAKFLRYMLPISPLLALFGAFLLVRLLDSARGWRRWLNDESRSDEPPAAKPADPTEPRADSPGLDLDVDDLLRLDGGTTILAAEADAIVIGSASATPLAAVGAGSVAAVQSPASDRQTILDAEALRWLELKGLSPELLEAAVSPVEVGRANGHRVDRHATLDAVGPWPSEPDWAWPVPKRMRTSIAGLAVLGSRWPTRAARALIAVVVGFSAFYSLAFLHMYDAPTTPVVASEWLYANAPTGSVLATEHWEEGMPVPIPTGSGVESAESHNFQNVTMPMYDDDTPEKLNTIVNNLLVSDYVVFFSNRLYGTVPRIPARYPMSQRYYQKLFGEQLGFTLVDVAYRYPNLLGVAFVDDTLNDPGLPTPALLRESKPAPITINLGHADESFSVYDHQKVLIFKKTQRLTADQLRALIGPPAGPTSIASTTPTEQYKSLLLTPAQEAIVQSGGTFHDLFDRTDLFNQVPLLDWVILSALIGLAAAPLGFYVFRALPDRGFLVSKTLGVLGVAWISWIAVSIGLGTATRLESLLTLAAFVAIGVLAGWAQRRELVEFARRHRSLLLFEEGLFWVAFLYDVGIRSLNPDLWHPTLGGEKPMDLAYLNAAIRSPIYPPYDPWYAGGYLNYYYFGQIIVGTITKMSGIVPTTAYNLIVPLLFALTVAGVFTVAYTLLHRPDDATPDRRAVGGGVLASLMVCVFGNIGGFGQLVGDIGQLAPSQVQSAIPGVGPAANFLLGTYAVTLGGRQWQIPQDWYWSSTRMLALLNINSGTGSINEFPYFTFLFADLHAHLIGLPLTLLALAICVNYLKSDRTTLEGAVDRLAEAWRSRVPAPRVLGAVGPALALLLTAGLATGALYPTNSWDYPTYVGVLALALLVPWYLAAKRSGRGLLVRLAALALIVLLSQVLYRPFSAYFQSFYSGVHLSDEKSEIRWYFVINGVFLVIMLSYFLLEGWTAYRRSGLVRWCRLFVVNWELAPRILRLRDTLVRRPSSDVFWVVYGLVALTAVVLLTSAAGMALCGVLLVFLVAALVLGLRRDRSLEECFVFLLFATGLAISIGTEQLVIDGDVGRMNTIFKFYEQIWVLYGVAGAVAFVRIVDRLGTIRISGLRIVWLTVIVAFFVMAAVYPVVGTISRVSQRFDPSIPPTLDGTAYMNRAVYTDSDDATRLTAQLHFQSDKAAIQWLQDNVQGTPTIVEGTRPIYRWGSRISIYTGLPTVIGWDWHQKQQRWGFQTTVDDRDADVQLIYQGPSVDQTMTLLRRYNVKYIVEGELERAFYPNSGEKFDSMVGSRLSVAYDRDGVKIYQVQ